MKRENDFKKIEKSLRLNYKLYDENETGMILKNLYNRIHPTILKDMNEGDDPIKFMKDNMKKTELIHSNFDSEVLLDFEEMKISENNKNNEFSGTVTILPLTSKKLQKVYPFEIYLTKGTGNLPKNSKAKADQIRTLDKSRIAKFIGEIEKEKMDLIDMAISIHLDLF